MAATTWLTNVCNPDIADEESKFEEIAPCSINTVHDGFKYFFVFLINFTLLKGYKGFLARNRGKCTNTSST